MSIDLPKWFDSYNRVARVYPVLLCALPLAALTTLLRHKFEWGVSEGLLEVILLAATLYALASVARSRGKRTEVTLIALWGGWPTTILLRHRDLTIDPLTKKRYHGKLAALSRLKFPDDAEEAQRPAEADQVYRSATRSLIEARRGAQFAILHAENASYGFRRNLLGLKPAAVTLALAVAGILSAQFLIGLTRPITSVALLSSIRQQPTAVVALIADLFYLAVLLFIVRDSFVWHAGCEYAEALLKTLDMEAP